MITVNLNKSICVIVMTPTVSGNVMTVITFVCSHLFCPIDLINDNTDVVDDERDHINDNTEHDIEQQQSGQY